MTLTAAFKINKNRKQENRGGNSLEDLRAGSSDPQEQTLSSLPLACPQASPTAMFRPLQEGPRDSTVRLVPFVSVDCFQMSTSLGL